MKKTLRLLFITLLIALTAALPAQAASGEMPRHAPNMYVNWTLKGSYDVMTVDWYCEKDAENTYWAVHNWDDGYAGFQNKDGAHVLLLSLWDRSDGTQPTVEYASDGTSGSFGGEGTGKHVFTNYDWKVGTWYTMRVETWSAGGKSYIGQWVREDGGAWKKTAVISYPGAGFSFTGDSMFQEDFTFNNLQRSCRLKNAYGRSKGTNTWDSWSQYQIENTYFPTTPPTWDNVNWNVCYDCDWERASDGSYVRVQSGGGDFTVNGKTAPPVVYAVVQAAKPAETGALSAPGTADTAPVSADGASAWARTELTAALAAGAVSDEVASSGWQNATDRLAAAEEITKIVELAAGKTIDEIAAQKGWKLDENAFSDTASKAVTFLRWAGVTNGVGGNRYDPDGRYTRAQMVAMIGRAAEKILGVSVSGSNPFSDVPSWAAAYVGYASSAKITGGIGNGKFDPNAVLQNQHTAVFAWRALRAWRP